MKSFAGSMNQDSYYKGGRVRTVELVVRVTVRTPPGFDPLSDSDVIERALSHAQPADAETTIGINPKGGSYWARLEARALTGPDDLEVREQ